MKYDNIIIGAGPAGLQLGYFFQKAAMNYVILEKSDKAGAFFHKYPHSGKLISINKKYTGRKSDEFNLRHDWNSLLSDNKLLFTDYSEDYYPENKDTVRYLNDYADEYDLNIVYNANVKKIRKGYKLQVEEEQKSKTYTCKNLIVATGLSKMVKPNIIDNTKRPILHYGEFPKDFFKKEENLTQYKNKSLLIIGNGNAAFELGNLLNPLCSSITIQGKRPKPWAMSTHYTGDLRGVYIPLYDTFLLKSLNGFDYETGKFIIDQETPTSEYKINTLCNPGCQIKHPYLENSISGFDNIIFCTGWAFDNSLFDFPVELTNNNKYPAITDSYESVTNDNLFFIGALMHSLDFKKSSGGFIHGFRYLIKHFFNVHFRKAFDITKFQEQDALVKHIMIKINDSSAIYQMYGQLSDTFYKDEKEYIYYNNVPINFFMSLPKVKDRVYFIQTLEYGEEHITDINKLGVRVSGLGTENKATLLHPVLRIVKDIDENVRKIIDIVHFDEDLYANYTFADKYQDKLLRTIKMMY